MRGCGGAPIPLDCWPPVGTSWTRIGAMLELLFAIVYIVYRLVSRRPAGLHTAQPNGLASKAGHFLHAKCAADGDARDTKARHTMASGG